MEPNGTGLGGRTGVCVWRATDARTNHSTIAPSKRLQARMSTPNEPSGLEIRATPIRGANAGLMVTSTKFPSRVSAAFHTADESWIAHSGTSSWKRFVALASLPGPQFWQRIGSRSSADDHNARQSSREAGTILTCTAVSSLRAPSAPSDFRCCASAGISAGAIELAKSPERKMGRRLARINVSRSNPIPKAAALTTSRQNNARLESRASPLPTTVAANNPDVVDRPLLLVIKSALKG